MSLPITVESTHAASFYMQFMYCYEKVKQIRGRLNIKVYILTQAVGHITLLMQTNLSR